MTWSIGRRCTRNAGAPQLGHCLTMGRLGRLLVTNLRPMNESQCSHGAQAGLAAYCRHALARCQSAEAVPLVGAIPTRRVSKPCAAMFHLSVACRFALPNSRDRCVPGAINRAGDISGPGRLPAPTHVGVVVALAIGDCLAMALARSTQSGLNSRLLSVRERIVTFTWSKVPCCAQATGRWSRCSSNARFEPRVAPLQHGFFHLELDTLGFRQPAPGRVKILVR